ncbi:MAG TPA: hypothetical protein VIK40_02415 [Geomonas sp.]
MNYGVILVGFALIFPGLAFAEVSGARKEAPSADNGRYQLFQGTYTAFDLKRQEALTQQAVFLIDTRTGQVKRYVNKIDTEGKYLESWFPTDTLSDKK